MISAIVFHAMLVILTVLATLGFWSLVDKWKGRKRAKAEKEWERIEAGQSGDLLRLLDTGHAVMIVRYPVGYIMAATRAKVTLHGEHCCVVTRGDPQECFGVLADMAFGVGEKIGETHDH